MEKLLDLLNVPASERTFAHAEIAQGLVTGSSLLAPIPIFPRYIEAEEDHRKEVPRAD
jgi:methionyl-tRNA synthetase